jgi:hypothetical protein
MTIEVIRRMTCDWCGNDDDQVSIGTHRLAFDRVTRDVELHAACIEEATVSYLIEKGRRASAEPMIPLYPPKPKVKCDLCGRVITSMGRGMHTTKHKRDDDKTPTYTDEPID